jgi:hypothetical protein
MSWPKHITTETHWREPVQDAPFDFQAEQRRGRSFVVVALVVLGFLVAWACTGCCASVTSTYVEADERCYDAVAPEYLDLIRHDARYDDAARLSREDTVALWRKRIDEAKRALAARAGTASVQTESR